MDGIIAERADVAAGVKQLGADAKRPPGLRLLQELHSHRAGDGPAAGALGGRAHLPAGIVERAKASGFAVHSLQRHGIQGAAAAPPATDQPYPMFQGALHVVGARLFR